MHDRVGHPVLRGDGMGVGVGVVVWGRTLEQGGCCGVHRVVISIFTFFFPRSLARQPRPPTNLLQLISLRFSSKHFPLFPKHTHARQIKGTKRRKDEILFTFLKHGGGGEGCGVLGWRGEQRKKKRSTLPAGIKGKN